jgi:hypothetical protein
MRAQVASALLALGALPLAAPAQCKVAGLTATDAQPGDGFASFLAISGDVAIVGAQFEDQLGTDAGAAYTFRQSGAQIWVPTGKLTAADGAPGDHFGFPVETSGKTMLVGALDDDDLGSSAGAVYLFDLVSGAWAQTAKLTAPDGGAGDQFGKSAALWKDHVVVGAVQDAPSGSVYVFERTESGAWFLQDKLVPGDPCTSFGFRVAVAGATILVGAPDDDDLGPGSGSVYVFTLGVGGWAETGKLKASDGAAGDSFGRSLAVDAEAQRLLVGAERDDDGGSDSGSAYVFERQPDESWLQTAKLTAADAQAGDAFGVSVELQGDLAVVGADEEDAAGGGAGAIYLFERAGGGWTQSGKLLPEGPGAGDHFGFPVRVDGGSLLAGARDDDPFGASSGSVQAYEIPDPAAPLHACPPQISLAQGGAQQLALSAGAQHAQELYFLAGSASGTVPGLALGSVLLPLNPDPYLHLTVNHPNEPPLSSSLGFLGAEGEAAAAFALPAGSAPSLAGLTVHHAFLVWDLFGSGTAVFASNAAPLSFIP